MVQVSVTKETFQKLNVLKAKGIVEKDGSSVIWDNVIDSLIITEQANPKAFLSAIKNTNGKVRTPKSEMPRKEPKTLEEAQKNIEDGKTVSSKVLEKISDSKRFVG